MGDKTTGRGNYLRVYAEVQGCDQQYELHHRPNYQRDWFIKVLLPLNRTPLTQQKIETLQDALEQATRIEDVVGY